MRTERSATPEAASTAADRFMFFSDAVLAIALTLLAVNLPLPTGGSGPAFLASAAEHSDAYLAFLVSFLVIAQQWRAHHRLFRYLVDAPQPLIVANTVWLLTIVVTPFATTVLWSGDGVGHGDFPWRFTLYAVVQAVAALSFLRFGGVIARDGLLTAGAPADLLAANRTRSIVLATVFLVSIGFAFLVGAWALVLWGILPVATSRIIHRVRHRPEVTAA
ncbi:MAG: TMEM175 family protein [Lapillicoccus sp.]